MWCVLYTRRLFRSNNFATSAASAEVYALLSVILITADLNVNGMTSVSWPVKRATSYNETIAITALSTDRPRGHQVTWLLDNAVRRHDMYRCTSMDYDVSLRADNIVRTGACAAETPGWDDGDVIRRTAHHKQCTAAWWFLSLSLSLFLSIRVCWVMIMLHIIMSQCKADVVRQWRCFMKLFIYCLIRLGK